MEIGRWVHIGDGNSIRCHEGNLRIGDKAVFGCNNVVNAYLDIEFGVVAGRRLVLHLRLRPRHRRHQHPDQGPGHRQEPRAHRPRHLGGHQGDGPALYHRRPRLRPRCTHAVVRGVIPDYAIAVGSPAKVVKNRKDAWDANAAQRAELERALADIERKEGRRRGRSGGRLAGLFVHRSHECACTVVAHTYG